VPLGRKNHASSGPKATAEVGAKSTSSRPLVSQPGMSVPSL
jgi:hypothetical protein